MIGHNPSTPGGLGIGVGTTIHISELAGASADRPWIVVADHGHPFDRVAQIINDSPHLNVTGAILQADDGNLVHNRLNCKIPIVDEVRLIEKVPLGMLAAIEVAEVGRIVETLSNPYGIATLFELDNEDTKHVVPLARSLVGNRSAVVIKTRRVMSRSAGSPQGGSPCTASPAAPRSTSSAAPTRSWTPWCRCAPSRM
nr:hypothetical protein [Tessaracoccus coleopterorum]